MSSASVNPLRTAATQAITGSGAITTSSDRATSTIRTARTIASLGDGRPVSVREAYAAGITRGQIRAALTAGTVTSIRRGVIAPTGVDAAGAMDPYRQRLEAFVRVDPDAVMCSFSAAHLLGVPVPDTAQAQRFIHVLGSRPRRRAGVWHHDFPAGSPTREPSGMNVTDKLRTAAQIALNFPLPLALIPLEAALRTSVLDLVEALHLPDDLAVAHLGAQRTVRELLDEVCTELAYRPGIPRLRAAAVVASPLSESPAESYAHGQLILFGYDVAQQVSIIDGDGVTRRLDFIIDGVIAGEVDGLMKYEGPDGRRRLVEEKRRDAALLAVGLPTARWTPAEMRDQPHVVRRRIDTVAGRGASSSSLASRP